MKKNLPDYLCWKPRDHRPEVWYVVCPDSMNADYRVQRAVGRHWIGSTGPNLLLELTI